jgi:hypothetical protein
MEIGRMKAPRWSWRIVFMTFHRNGSKAGWSTGVNALPTGCRTGASARVQRRWRDEARHFHALFV